MRRLGRFFLVTLAGIGLFVVLAVGGGIWAYSAMGDKIEPRLPSSMVLSLDLEARFREAPSSDPFAAFSGKRAYVTRQVVAAIDAASADPKVKGLFATVGGGMTLATAQELRDAVSRFKASGKPAVAFAETMGEGGNGTVDYYLSTAFSQIWLQPSGELGLVGFSAETPFVKGALDMLGIRPQMAGRKEYKSAIETFTETAYTAPHRESMEALLESWAGQAVAGIAQGRHMGEDKAKALFGKGPFLAAEALSAGLVDHLGYRDQALQAAGGSGKKGELVDVAAYGAHLPRGEGTKVAVITGSGAIMRGGDDNGFGDDDNFAAAVVAQAFRDAIDDPKVKAILFRVNSPGGASGTKWAGRGPPARKWWCPWPAWRLRAVISCPWGRIGWWRSRPPSPVPSGCFPARWCWPTCGPSWESPGTGPSAATTPT